MDALAVDLSRSDEKPGSRNHDHDRAENNERQACGVGESLNDCGEISAGR
jgi:hypothetical protein